MALKEKMVLKEKVFEIHRVKYLLTLRYLTSP